MWISLEGHLLSARFVVAGVLETENELDRDAIRKAKVLYSSCMNESRALSTCVEILILKIERLSADAADVE